MLVHNFFVFFVEIFGATLTPHKETCISWHFFRSHEPNHLQEMSLSYLKNIPIYYPLGKYKLSIHSSLDLEYC